MVALLNIPSVPKTMCHGKEWFTAFAMRLRELCCGGHENRAARLGKGCPSSPHPPNFLSALSVDLELPKHVRQYFQLFATRVKTQPKCHFFQEGLPYFMMPPIRVYANALLLQHFPHFPIIICSLTILSH